MTPSPVAALEAHYEGRRVLVTGHTGFKGAWLVAWLHRLGAEVSGLSLAAEPHQLPLARLVADRSELASEVIGDITDPEVVFSAFERARPETVFHLAAQPLVRASYTRPVETYAVNVIGTVQVLDAARNSGTDTIVCVTTDKCYENVEQMWPYRETDPMGGFDPYSASKGAAELAIASYRRSFFGAGSGVGCASARAGNVVGGGDLSPDRLVPDIYRAMVDQRDLVLRRPEAERPWQHVLECLSGYLLLGERLAADPEGFSSGWNFGPETDERTTVLDFVELMTRALGEQAPAVRVEPDGPHEASRLALDITKARELLGWRPILSLDERAGLTAEWYHADIAGAVAPEILDTQIDFVQRRWGRGS